jgi:hypothetical protein
MTPCVPSEIAATTPGTFTVYAGPAGVILYLRESRYGETKYPRHCPLEVRLLSWDQNSIIAVSLLLRLDRSDLWTFDAWLNPGLPDGVRILKALATQKQIDVHIVTDAVDRVLRTPNTLASGAAILLHELRDRISWTADQFAAERARIERLYPSSKSLWWAEM